MLPVCSRMIKGGSWFIVCQCSPRLFLAFCAPLPRPHRPTERKARREHSYTTMDGETMKKSFDDILNGKKDQKKDFEITPEVSDSIRVPSTTLNSLLEGHDMDDDRRSFLL